MAHEFFENMGTASVYFFFLFMPPFFFATLSLLKASGPL
jgi:hypothetical protein